MTPYTTLIDAAALHRLMEDRPVLLLDCGFDLADPQAGRQAYAAGHIPGARYLHLDEDLSAPAGARGRHPLPDPSLLAAKLRKAGLNQGQQVVAYDSAGGAFAARLWWLLRWLDHQAVAVLDGGKPAWAAEGYPLEQGEPSGRAEMPGAGGDFTSTSPGEDRIIDVNGVLDNIGTQALLVIDARAPERFAGQPNPLDPVAGHIPGARNRFFRDNLDGDGRFRPAHELAADFRAILGGIDANRAVLQCGSGVTACHNALAMEIAGLHGARLYPGSWSEWIGDPARPVERSEAGKAA